MLDLLIHKIENYEDLKTHQINQGEYYFGEYYFEEIESGLVLSAPRSIIFFNNNGKILRLSEIEKCNDLEWKLYCEFNDVLLQKENCKIEIPIDKKIVKASTKNYHYLEVQRPGNSLGYSIFDDEITQDYFLEYIDHVSISLEYLMVILKKNNYHFLPSDLLSPYKRHRNNNCYYWVDIKHWILPIDRFIERKIKTLYHILLLVVDNQNYNFNYNLIMNKADLAWSKYSK